MPPIKRTNRLYKKAGSYKDTRKFIIVCEGIREAKYFSYFKAKYDRLIVEVIEPSEEYDGHSAPKKLQERAAEYITSQNWDESLDDEIWFIIDTDRWGYQLHNLADIVKNSKNWFLANSNPCFEVWLIYHKSKTQVKEKDPKVVKQLLHTQTSGGYNLHNYIIRLLQAIEFSKQLDSKSDQDIAEIGITKVYKLGEKIVELLPYTDGRLKL